MRLRHTDTLGVSNTIDLMEGSALHLCRRNRLVKRPNRVKVHAQPSKVATAKIFLGVDDPSCALFWLSVATCVMSSSL